MTDEQPQKKKKSGRKSDIGGIQQYATFGSEEHEDTQPSQMSDSQISRHPESQEEDIQSSQKTDIQISSNPESQMVHYSESELAGLSASQRAESQDKKMVSYLREKKPERKAQIAYLPPGLIKRLKRFAVDHDLEISIVVQVAVQEFLERKEKEEVP